MPVTATQRVVLVEKKRTPSRCHFLGRTEWMALQYGAEPSLFHGLLPTYVRVTAGKEEKKVNMIFHCHQPAWDVCEHCDDVTDDEAGDVIYFEKAKRFEGKGEKVLAEYDGLLMMGHYYKAGDQLLFKPTDDPEHPVVLCGADCDKLRVRGVAKLLVRVL